MRAQQRSGRTMAVLVSLLAVAVTASCAELFGLEHSDISVSAYLSPPATGPLVMVTRVGGAHTTVTVDAAQRSRVRTLVGLRYGSVPSTVVLRNSAGDTLAAVEFTHSLEDDSEQWVSARIGSLRPDGFCTGPLVFAPVSGSNTDTLFVNYGSMPKNVIC